MSDNSTIEWTQASKWCTRCKARHPIADFGRDRSRGDGLAASCLKSRKTGHPRGWHGRPSINPCTGKPGPAPVAARDGDKKQARRRVNRLVANGLIPRPADIPCMDCGDMLFSAETRHEYDHAKGYDGENQLYVEAVCQKCHRNREEARR